MNINQLKYFVAVAESLSFTKAASLYYISQTAITQQIQGLEEQVGMALFDRSTRPIQLTPAGRAFLGEAKAICERMNLAVNKAKEASTGLLGSIRVGYTKGYEHSNLSNILRVFHRKYPNVLLSCYRQDSDALSAGLFNLDYDIIFTWDSTNIVVEKNVEHHLYEKVPLVVAMPGSHPLAHRTFLTRKDLKGESILYMTPSKSGVSYGDDHFMDLYRRAGYDPNISFRSNDSESILMMVAAEEGISILPVYATNKIISAENIVFCPLVGGEEYENIICVWKSDNPNEALQSFVTLLSEDSPIR